MPSVSVVIPAYNAAEFLERAIGSVLKQDHRPIEIVVVDDGSSDGTADIAARHGPLVRLFRHDLTQGPSKARNRGILESQGDVVAFLDADDEWTPGHVSRNVHILGRNPQVMWSCSSFRRQWASGKIVNSHVPLWGSRDWLGNVFAPSGLLCTCSLLIRRTVFDEVGLFDETLRRAEDWDLWIRIGIKWPKIGFTRRVGVIYWQRDGSLSHCIPDAEHALREAERAIGHAQKGGANALKLVQPTVRRWIREAYWAAVAAGDRGIVDQIGRAHGQCITSSVRAHGTLVRLRRWLGCRLRGE